MNRFTYTIIAMLLLTAGAASSAIAQDELEPADDSATSTAMSEDEVEAELQRIEEALSDGDELKEFVPSKPLAADLPIALPSDL